MPVRIIRRSAQAKLAAPPLPAVAPEATSAEAPPVGAEAHPRGWQIGDAVLLRKIDLSYEQAHEKFLLHKVKAGVWYRLLGLMEEEQRIKLVSQVKFQFDARIDHTMSNNYVMAVLPMGTEEPPEELLTFVNKILPRVHSSAKEPHAT